MKYKKDYVRKYGKAIKHAPNTEYKDLLIQGKDNRLKKINPLDVIHNGVSFGLMLDLYNDLKGSHSDFKNDVGHSISTLISTLKAKGYNTPNVELNALIEDIGHLLIIEPSKEYYNFKCNEDGYIIGLDDINIVIEKGLITIPDDYDKGYWKIEGLGFVLDEELYRAYWSVN
jgi:hypothetical protein